MGNAQYASHVTEPDMELSDLLRMANKTGCETVQRTDVGKGDYRETT